MARGVQAEAVTRAINRLIDQSGMSQNEIARRLGNGGARKQLWGWQNGGGITEANAARLEKALGAPEGTLVRVVRAEALRQAARRQKEAFARQRAELLRRWPQDA